MLSFPAFRFEFLNHNLTKKLLILIPIKKTKITQISGAKTCRLCKPSASDNKSKKDNKKKKPATGKNAKKGTKKKRVQKESPPKELLALLYI
jgi:hypothetical protein